MASQHGFASNWTLAVSVTHRFRASGRLSLAHLSAQFRRTLTVSYISKSVPRGRVLSLAFDGKYQQSHLTMRVKRRLNSTRLVDVVTDLFTIHGVRAFIRSDNGPEFVAEASRD